MILEVFAATSRRCSSWFHQNFPKHSTNHHGTSCNRLLDFRVVSLSLGGNSSVFSASSVVSIDPFAVITVVGSQDIVTVSNSSCVISILLIIRMEAPESTMISLSSGSTVETDAAPHSIFGEKNAISFSRLVPRTLYNFWPIQCQAAFLAEARWSSDATLVKPQTVPNVPESR